MVTQLEAVPFKNTHRHTQKKMDGCMMSSSTVNAISHTTLIILYKWSISIKKNPILPTAPTCQTCYPPQTVNSGAHKLWKDLMGDHRLRQFITGEIKRQLEWISEHWDLKSHVKWCTIYHFVVKKTQLHSSKTGGDKMLNVFFSRFHQQNDLFFFVWEQKNIFVWTEAFIEAICVRVWVATGILFTPSLWHE